MTEKPDEREEIEVTPEMIRAGVAELLEYDPDFGSRELEMRETVWRIFTQMLAQSGREAGA